MLEMIEFTMTGETLKTFLTRQGEYGLLLRKVFQFLLWLAIKYLRYRLTEKSLSLTFIATSCAGGERD